MQVQSLLEFEAPKKLMPGTYDVFVKSYKDNSDEKGSRLNIELQFDDKVRNYTVFPTNVSYITSCLQNQFEIAEAVSLKHLLDLAKENPIKAYVSYNDFGLNIAFHEPKVAEEAINTQDVEA